MPRKAAAKRKSKCIAVQRGDGMKESEQERYGEKEVDGGAEPALPARCNQTRVNRLFHRWLIQRIL